MYASTVTATQDSVVPSKTSTLDEQQCDCISQLERQVDELKEKLRQANVGTRIEPYENYTLVLLDGNR